MQDTNKSKWVVMGRVLSPYGVLGWIKVHPDTETLDSLLDYEVWWLGRDPDWQAYTVEAAKIHGLTLLVKLQGVDDRNAAFACKAKQIAVPREALPEVEEDEYYWSDLIGLKVRNLENVDFGQVTEVFETGANDVLVVKGERERLIPFVAQVVLNVDLAKAEILLDWPVAWDD